ncbi:MAG: putative Ig domain-containing protein [Proteobacteria bacterium]|nr:putative Ig domain-containing protein [Pseudomonadota bacterium]
MASTSEYLQYAETALAAYALSLTANSDSASAFVTAGMTKSQAARFDEEWTVLAQSADAANGFSAVLLQKKSSNEKVLAIRGTEKSHVGVDYLTDYVNIFQLGTVVGMAQYQALETFYEQLITSGKLTAAEQIVVTGHSLGGFLAQAFTARHPNVVSSAYTYNAPGFGGATVQLFEFLGITDASAPNSKIINVRATDGVSGTAGLGQVLGSVQQVRIEGGTANPVYYHSIATLTDTLSAYRAFAELQPSLSVDQIGRLFVAAGNGDRRLEGALDALRTVFIGSSSNDVNRTPTGDREALFNNLYALQSDASFVASMGQVQLVEAGSGMTSAAKATDNAALAYRYALLELLPFAVVANSDALNQALYGYYTQRLSLYDPASGAGSLTGEWIDDRSAMLDWLAVRNSTGTAGVLTGGVAGRTITTSVNYEDLGSGTQVLVGAANTISRRVQVIFGGDGADSRDGFGRNDRLYGGAGDDSLNGQGGADYIEGNADNDLLDGGEGNDTLLGGAGTDTLRGGEGDDSMAGGAGADRYEIAAASGFDTIAGAEADDKLFLAGRQLSGAGTLQSDEAGVRVWVDTSVAGAAVAYQYNAAARELLVTGQGSAVLVRDFDNGDMGITAPGGNQPVLSPLTSDSDYADNLSGSHDGMGGHDVLAGLLFEDQRFAGGPGNDLLYGQDGQDTLDGGEGNDYLNGGAGSDLIFGGAGSDLINGQNDVIVVLNELGNRPIETVWPEVAATWSWGWQPGWETPGNHMGYVQGTDIIDALWTLRGDGAPGRRLGTGVLADASQPDTVFGGAGDDMIGGTLGDDYLSGDDGDDVVGGALGDDLLFGGAGNDEIAGDFGDDRLDGGSGADWLIGGYGADHLLGGTEADVLWGDLPTVENTKALPPQARPALMGEDYLDGGDGDDYAAGGAFDDAVFGGNGNDTLRGEGAGYAAADSGDDYLDGEAGNDSMLGDAGDDTLYGGAGNDTLNGDDAPWNLAGGDHGDDVLDGEAGDDALWGLGGNDTLYGGSDNDMLVGDADDADLPANFHGNDLLDGGDGNDTLFGGGGADSLNGGSGSDTLFGEDGNDLLDGGEGIDFVFGGKGVDTLIGDTDDVLDGGEGDDVLQVSTRGLSATGPTTLLRVDDAQGVNRVVVDGQPVALAQLFVVSGRRFVSAPGGLFEVGEKAALDGLVVERAGGGTTSLQDIVRENNGGEERVRSGAWTSAGFIYTADIAQAQSIGGSSLPEWLQGGAGDDDVQGAAGSDRVSGGAGNDVLAGGAGEDIVEGGAGNDRLFGDGDDVAVADKGRDVFVFKRGDGADAIVSENTLDAPRDVIRFGAGISAADVQVANLGSAGSGTLRLFIDYGAGDSITLDDGGETGIERLEFADGTSLSMAEIIGRVRADERVPVAPGVPSALTGSNTDDLLVGTAADEELRGLEGDDTLDGAAGRDLLVGGAGRNTYRFHADSGSDQIAATQGETGVLSFDAADAAGLQTWAEGNDRIVSSGSGQSVRLRDYGDGQAYAGWQVLASTGQAVSLASVVDGANAPPPNAGWQRSSFMDRLLYEQRHWSQGYASGAWSSRAVIPMGVTLRDVSGSQLALPMYLGTGTESVTREVTYRAPVYDYRSVTRTRSVPTYTLLDPFPSRGVPAEGGSSSQSGATRPNPYVVATGYRTETYTEMQSYVTGWTQQTYSITVEEARDHSEVLQVTGTAGADLIESAPVAPGAAPALFRGSIESGAGDDVIRLASGWAGDSGGAMARTEDWVAFEGQQRESPNAEWFMTDPAVVAHYDHGSGAWIDAGAGNDSVLGSDANDVIIGGAGSDTLDGQAGADRYLIGVEHGAVDRIADIATLSDTAAAAIEDWRVRNEWNLLAYGPQISGYRHNRDVVEFDASVHLERLSYRYIDSAEGPGYVTLELLQDGESFLQVDYRGEPGSDAGVEDFVFADGATLTLQQLLQTIPRARVNHAPVLTVPLADQAAVLGNPFSYQVPADAITDPDAADTLTYSATLADGSALPAWLVFDADARSFTGMPPSVSTIEVTVRARDREGLSVADTFALATAPPPDQTLNGGAGADTLIGGAGNDTLNGAGGNDRLEGRAGNDRLNGGVGNDTMAGGAGDDTYIVNAAGDVVIEDAGGGMDLIQSSVSLGTLADYVENATLTGSSASSLRGNALANDLRGNALANFIDGGDGDDTLDGGAAGDTMTGGRGNDIYQVDALDDAVVEQAGEGVDTIVSSVSLAALAANVENATLTGGATLNVTGNALDNRLEGNRVANVLAGGAGNDTIDGGAGADTMLGGSGDDVYYVNVATDSVVEVAGEGMDTIVSSATLTALAAEVENATLTGPGNLRATGNALANVLVGNAGANTLNGGDGNDTLDGAAGNDSLLGGAGADLYRFGIGAGTDTIVEDDTTASVSDTVAFGAGIAQGDVQFRRVGNNLEVRLGATADALVVKNWYLGSRYQVETFRFADGSILTGPQIEGRALAAGVAGVAAADALAVDSRVRLQPVSLLESAGAADHLYLGLAGSRMPLIADVLAEPLLAGPDLDAPWQRQAAVLVEAMASFAPAAAATGQADVRGRWVMLDPVTMPELRV